MTGWLRRIRGALGMGLTWAAGWFGLWATAGLVGLLLRGPEVWAGLLDAALMPVAGFVAGTTFGIVLGIAERDRRFDQVSVGRFAAWGALGGLLMFGVAGGAGAGLYGLVVNGAIVSALCGASAALTLLVARRSDDRELLAQGEQAAEVGLTEEERRELLGT